MFFVFSLATSNSWELPVGTSIDLDSSAVPAFELGSDKT